MPKWNCSVLEMLCRSGRITWVKDDLSGFPVLDLHGKHYTNSGRPLTEATRTTSKRMSSPVRWGCERLKLHRIMYFNLLDDRHLFNMKVWTKERENAERLIQRYRNAIQDYNDDQTKIERVKTLPHPTLGWRTRIGTMTGDRAMSYVDDTPRGQEEQWVGKKIFVVPRPMWLCVSQQEIDLLTHTGDDMHQPETMRVNFTPTQDFFTAMWQPFACKDWQITTYDPRTHIAPRYRVKSIRMFKGEPDADNLKRIRKSFRPGLLGSQKVRWAQPMPLVHPEIAGPARVEMFKMYLRGATDAEVLDEMRFEHGERRRGGDWVYMDSPVSKDWTEHYSDIRKELYG